MISANPKKYQRKKRDASYYREYRKKKKGEESNILQFPRIKTESIDSHVMSEAVISNKTNLFSLFTKELLAIQNFNIKSIFLFCFISILTLVLIRLSTPFYRNGHSEAMAYLLASLVELSIIFLLTLQTEVVFEKFAKWTLVFALSGYALIPIVMNPVQNAQSKLISQQTQTEILIKKEKSIQSEITTRKEKAQLLQERGRISMAQLELQSIALLENDLRNTFSQVQPIATTEIELHSSYILALQRLLLMLCNLFFVHQLFAKSKNVLRNHKGLVPIFRGRVCVT